MLTRHRTTRQLLASVAIATVASLLFALPAAATPDTTPAVEAECVEDAEVEGDVECVVEEEEAPAATGTLYIRKTIRDDLQLANIADALENDLKKVASHPNALTNTDYAGPTLFEITVTQDGSEVSANGWSRSGGRSNTYKASYTVIAGIAVTLSEADLAGWDEGTFECRPGDVGTNGNGFWIEGGKWASAVESDTVIVPEGGKVTCRIMNTQVEEPEVIEEPEIEED